MTAYSDPGHRLLDQIVTAIKDNTRAQERQAAALEEIAERLDQGVEFDLQDAITIEPGAYPLTVNLEGGS